MTVCYIRLHCMQTSAFTTPAPGMDRAKLRDDLQADPSSRSAVGGRPRDAMDGGAGGAVRLGRRHQRGADSTGADSGRRRGLGMPSLRRRLRAPTRALNFLLALLALVALLPVLLLLALVIKLTVARAGVLPPGAGRPRPPRRRATPANHRAPRDLGGQPFTIYKFRTMRVDAERAERRRLGRGARPRVTPVGRVLRQYRLDEIPQLLNVLRGEMNIVGPRPERPTIFAELREHIAEYPLRQRAKPGITGLAQINHHYDRSLDDVRTKVSFDLEYIRRQSLREDLRIMLKTLPVVLFRRGGW